MCCAPVRRLSSEHLCPFRAGAADVEAFFQPRPSDCSNFGQAFSKSSSSLGRRYFALNRRMAAGFRCGRPSGVIATRSVRGPGYGRISFADPQIGCARFGHHIVPPAALPNVLTPNLRAVLWRVRIRRQVFNDAVSRRVELQAFKRLVKDAEVIAQDRKLELVVIARLVPMPQVMRPTADDAPGREMPARRLANSTGVPGAP